MADTTRPYHWGRPNPDYAGPTRARRQDQTPDPDPMEDMSDQDTTSDHFTFTGERRTVPSGQVLNQIEAAVDLPDAGVSAGDVGGWVGPNARLLGKAWLSPDAMLLDRAVLDDNARLGDSAVASGNARVDGNAFCAGRSQVTGQAHVTDFARVSGDARITGNAKITGSVHVGGDAHVSGDTVLEGEVEITGGGHGDNGEHHRDDEHVPVVFRWLDGIRRGLSGRG